VCVCAGAELVELVSLVVLDEVLGLVAAALIVEPVLEVSPCTKDIADNCIRTKRSA
jgi:hypothetical protein